MISLRRVFLGVTVFVARASGCVVAIKSPKEEYRIQNTEVRINMRRTAFTNILFSCLLTSVF
jgi:hypothetical protein